MRLREASRVSYLAGNTTFGARAPTKSSKGGLWNISKYIERSRTQSLGRSLGVRRASHRNLHATMGLFATPRGDKGKRSAEKLQSTYASIQTFKSSRTQRGWAFPRDMFRPLQPSIDCGVKRPKVPDSPSWGVWFGEMAHGLHRWHRRHPPQRWFDGCAG